MCLDFKSSRVAVAHYILRAHRGAAFLRSWVLEGSENKVDWVELDRREDEKRLKGPKFVGAFEVCSVVESRFVRIRSIGPDWMDHNYLFLAAIELFGGLRIPRHPKEK
jgi:hypothetical protein